MAASTPPWKRRNPKKASERTVLTPAQKAAAKRAAEQAGRRYPNLVDNMRAAAMAKKQATAPAAKAAAHPAGKAAGTSAAKSATKKATSGATRKAAKSPAAVKRSKATPA